MNFQNTPDTQLSKNNIAVAIQLGGKYHQIGLERLADSAMILSPRASGLKPLLFVPGYFLALMLAQFAPKLSVKVVALLDKLLP